MMNDDDDFLAPSDVHQWVLLASAAAQELLTDQTTWTQLQTFLNNSHKTHQHVIYVYTRQFHI